MIEQRRHTLYNRHRRLALMPMADDRRIILAALRDKRGLLIIGVLIGTAIFLVGAIG